MSSIIVGITGASGGVYAVTLLEYLASNCMDDVHVIISPNGCEVLRTECDLMLDPENPVDLAEQMNISDARLHVHPYRRMSAPISSGSFKADKMVIVPCSMRSAGLIANVCGENVIHRAADVMLKERRKLILVPREMPLHAGHLKNLLTLAEMGAIIMPPSPAFYHDPEDIEDLINFVVGRVLDALEVPNDLYRRWGEPDEG